MQGEGVSETIPNRRELSIDHGDLFVVNQIINRIARYIAFAEDEHHFGLRYDATVSYSPLRSASIVRTNSRHALSCVCPV